MADSKNSNFGSSKKVRVNLQKLEDFKEELQKDKLKSMSVNRKAKQKLNSHKLTCVFSSSKIIPEVGNFSSNKSIVMPSLKHIKITSLEGSESSEILDSEEAGVKSKVRLQKE